MNTQIEITADNIPRAGRREWIGLAVLALPCMIYSMDLTVLDLAIPRLSAELKPSSAQLLWIIDIYGFMVAGFLITMGTLGDRIGRRRLLLIGAGAFGIASLFAAYAVSPGMLIAARAVLGMAGATLAPSTLSLIRNMFHDPRQRTVAIGIWITSFSVGGAIGPVIGGALLQHFSWGSVFLIAEPVMILLLILGPVLLPEYRDPSARCIDILSVLLSLFAVLSIIFGLKKIAAYGLAWLPVISIFAGLITSGVFLSRQRKLKDPLIDLKLFHSASFNASLLVYTMVTFMGFSFFIYLYQYMQLIAELSPIQSGLWSLPIFFAFIIGSLLCPLIVRRVHPGTVMIIGLLITAIGFGLLTLVNSNTGIGWLITGCFIYSIGITPAVVLTTDLIVGSVPPERAGIASAISETGSEFGGALGIAFIGSLGVFIYRYQLTGNIPANISPAVATAAKETLGAAVAEAKWLSPITGTALRNAANNAFLSGMKLSAFINMLISLALAILCWFRLRPAPHRHNQ